MVACRITEARNIAANNHHLHSRSMGSLSGGQVPLKKYKQTRVSSLTTILIAILHWIWPPDRCNNCHSIYSSPHLNENNKGRQSVSHIRRSLDGRFVLSETGSFTKLNAIGGSQDGLDEVDEPRLRDNSSQYSSSDDGGFLSRRNFITARASWRRPLVASPSQLSLQSAADSARGFIQGLAGGLLKLGSGLSGGADTALEDARYQNVYRTNNSQSIYRNLNNQQATGQQPLHINTISSANNAALYTPSRVSRIFSSSPASSQNGAQTLHQQTLVPAELSLMQQQSPWSLTIPSHAFQQQHFSDLSSVYPSSAERSLPNTTASGGNLSRYRYFAPELPSLRTIQEETRRLSEQQQQQQQQQQQKQQHQNSSFIPLQLPSSPSWRHAYYQGPHYSGGLGPYHSYRPRTRWYPRHYARLLGRTQSELMSPLPHLNLRSASAIGGLGLDASPESRSSSSGFGSKNNSNHPQGSHHSGSTSEWRLLPPYRPPPPPPNSAYFGTQQLLDAPQQAQPQAQTSHATLPYYQHTNSSSSGTNYYGSSLGRPLTPPYTMSHWLDMISRLNAATESVHLPKSVDVGSVDGHYEFDPSTPTPSASTPTGGLIRDDFNLHIDTTGHHHHSLPGSIFHTHASSLPPLLAGSNSFGGYSGGTQRTQRYDNIEARLQAMKEEFYAYRKRQALNHNSGAVEFESVC